MSVILGLSICLAVLGYGACLAFGKDILKRGKRDEFTTDMDTLQDLTNWLKMERDTAQYGGGDNSIGAAGYMRLEEYKEYLEKNCPPDGHICFAVPENGATVLEIIFYILAKEGWKRDEIACVIMNKNGKEFKEMKK